MESLARLVVTIMLFTILSGPTAIAMTMIRTENQILTILRKIFHGIFASIALFLGLMFLINGELQPVIRLIALFSLAMAYVALRREYFPDLRVLSPILVKLGLKQSGMNNGTPRSRFGPVSKWFHKRNVEGTEGVDSE